MSAGSVFEFAPLDPASAPAPAAPDAPAEPAVDVAALIEAARAEGYAAGVAGAQAQLEPAARALETVGGELAALRADVAGRIERGAVELALRIAEQALQGALAVDPERVIDAVRGALRRLVERDRVLILVNPDDLETVREHAGRLVAELGGIEHCGVEADRRVSRGGAIVRTSEGEVDATIETKLGRAREVVEAELRA